MRPDRHAYRVIVADCRKRPADRAELMGLAPTIARLLREGVRVVILASHNPGVELQIRSRYARNLHVAVEERADVNAIVARVAASARIDPREVLVIDRARSDLAEILRTQAALHPVRLPIEPTEDPRWRVVEDGFVLAREHEIESIMALSNGYLGTRNALVEGSRLSSPATFIAGVFDDVPNLVQMPDWTSVGVTLDGDPLELDAGEILHHRRMLDLLHGMSWREWRQRDPHGRISNIRGMRMVSLRDRHISFQSITLTPENYSATIVAEGSASAVVETPKRVTAAFSAASILERPEALYTFMDAGKWELPIEIGQTYRLDRIFSVYTSRDVSDPVQAARAHLEEVLEREDAQGIVDSHVAAWRSVWRGSDVRVEGDAEAQRGLRFAIHHLVAAANPEDDRVSIGARALTGWAYRGHVFWDTEIFMLPFFILTRPETARTLLMYRHRTLPAARERAASFGYRGALYPWESADTGEDVTPRFVPAPNGEIVRIYVGEEEQHVSADVAYAVWSYWRWTGDDRFLLDAGAEILLETARFWASRVVLGDDDLFHIRRVIGPDEYHEHVDDNAFTNGMAQWNLEIGAEIAELIAARWPDEWRALAERIALDPDEPREWLRRAARMYTGLDPNTGIIEQFRGYFDLEPLELSEYAARTVPIDLVLGLERIRRSQVIKQADVIMLLYLLWDRFPPEVREKNFRFYEPRTDHGSSLSPPIHALVAARLGDLELAERYFKRTMEIDLANNMGNAAGGIHAAALGGLWQSAVFGFAGLRFTEQGPVLEPHLPPRWKRFDVSILWRGQRFDLSASASEVPP